MFTERLALTSSRWQAGRPQAMVFLAGVTVSAKVDATNGLEIQRSKTGFLDPVFSVRTNLWGSKALKMEEFVKTPQKFQGYLLFTFAVPAGSYDQNAKVNIGTNCWAFRTGIPLVVPFGNPAKRTTLEIGPTATFFTNNNHPTGTATVKGQDPLWVLESHLSTRFKPKWWGSFDLRGRTGGTTTTDGVRDNNRQGVLGGGVSTGYDITPRLSVNGSYGAISGRTTEPADMGSARRLCTSGSEV